jgi:RimJ/RimL family protein N-acetyltransferase
MTASIQTERLVLELATTEDVADIHVLHSFPEVDRYNTLGIPDALEDTAAIMQPLLDANHSGEKYTYIVRQKATNQFIGMVGVTPGKAKYRSAEIWYKLMPQEWGKGFATELCKAIIQFCFNTLNLHRVEAGCAVDNIASVKVLEKSGMKLEGQRRQTLPLAGGWSDNFEYSILDTDEVP